MPILDPCIYLFIQHVQIDTYFMLWVIVVVYYYLVFLFKSFQFCQGGALLLGSHVSLTYLWHSALELLLAVDGDTDLALPSAVGSSHVFPAPGLASAICHPT